MLWLIILGYGLALFVISPRSHDIRGFYWGHDEGGREAGLWLLSGAGKYGILLGVNLYGLLLCTVLFLLPAGIVALTARQGGSEFLFRRSDNEHSACALLAPVNPVGAGHRHLV